MKQKLLYLLLATLFLILCAGNALATNITIFDTLINGSSSNNWHNTTAEDNETEPNTQTDQAWDLEKFDLTGSKLRMEGGYDFKNGYGGKISGDIFIDVNGDAVWGSAVSGASATNSYYKFDYAIDLAFDSGKFFVYELDDNSVMDVTSYVVESNPWQLNSGSKGSSIADGALSYGTWDDGETHYYAEVDMQWLFDTGNTSFLSHFTYECGNDLMIGQVPEPATILLSGLGLLGMAAFLRRRYIKKA